MRDKFLNGIHSGIRTASFAQQDLALLVHGEHAASGSLGRLLESNGTNEGGTGVAEEGVGQILLGLEGGIGLGGISGETVDGQSGRSQMCVVVAEQADLLGACRKRDERVRL